MSEWGAEQVEGIMTTALRQRECVQATAAFQPTRDSVQPREVVFVEDCFLDGNKGRTL